MLPAQQDNLYTTDEARASGSNTFSTSKIRITSKLWTADKKCTLYDCKLYKTCLQEWKKIQITGKKLSNFNRLLPCATRKSTSLSLSRLCSTLVSFEHGCMRQKIWFGLPQATSLNRFNCGVEGYGLLVNLRDRDNKGQDSWPNVSAIQMLHFNSFSKKLRSLWHQIVYPKCVNLCQTKLRDELTYRCESDTSTQFPWL